MQLSTLNFGTALVYWIDFGFNSNSNLSSYAWRVPCILQCVFLFPMLLLILLIPETPRWLAAHDRSDESLAVLRRLRGGKEEDEIIVDLHKEIVATAVWEKSIGAGSWKDLVRMIRLEAKEDSLRHARCRSLNSLVESMLSSVSLRTSLSQTSIRNTYLFHQTTRQLSFRTAWALISTPLLSWPDVCRHGSSSHHLYPGSS